MSNPSKAKGTDAEVAVRNVFIDNGFPHCERRALNGALDKGDLSGLIGICVEVKGGTAAELASPAQIDKWLQETETERQNADADYGLLVMKIRGVGYARAELWAAVLPAWQFLSLAGIRDCPPVLDPAPIRLHLRDAVALLRLAGYGDTPTESENAA